jgi:hypothetical protein
MLEDNKDQENKLEGIYYHIIERTIESLEFYNRYFHLIFRWSTRTPCATDV